MNKLIGVALALLLVVLTAACTQIEDMIDSVTGKDEAPPGSRYSEEEIIDLVKAASLPPVLIEVEGGEPITAPLEKVGVRTVLDFANFVCHGRAEAELGPDAVDMPPVFDPTYVGDGRWLVEASCYGMSADGQRQRLQMATRWYFYEDSRTVTRVD